MAIDPSLQQQKLEELRDQLSRVNALFEEQKKALGVTDEDLEKLTDSPMPPALQSMMAEAAESAKTAGRQAASGLKSEIEPAKPHAMGMRRRGLSI
jgi:archaellum component FlaC